MEVLNFIENDDGSATLEIEMMEEEQHILIEHAVNDLLRKQLEKNTSDS